MPLEIRLKIVARHVDPLDDCCRLVLPYHAVKHATDETEWLVAPIKKTLKIQTKIVKNNQLHIYNGTGPRFINMKRYEIS